MREILLIDRDHVRRRTFTEALAHGGFQVAHFESGNLGLKHLLAHPVRGVVLEHSSSYDPSTPVPSGKRIVEEITDCDAFLPLMVICDRGDVLDDRTVAAADLVLRHPVAGAALVDALKDLLSESLRERAQRKTNCVFMFR
jgi:FixJ family two-component response regulator